MTKYDNRTWTVPSFLVVVAVLLAHTPARADDDAGKLVAAGIKAHGGEAALKKGTTAEYKMKGTMLFLGEDAAFTGTVAYQLPGLFRMTVVTTLMGTEVTIVEVGNGDKVQTTLNGIVLKLDDKAKAELRQRAAAQDVAQLYPLLDKEKYTLRAGKDARVAGVECGTVLVEGKRTKPMTLYFDKKTGLLHATVCKALEPGTNKEVEKETVMTEYTEVAGCKLPLKHTVKHDGKVFSTATFSDARLAGVLDPKVFAVEE